MEKNPAILSVEASIIDLPTIRPHKLSMATMMKQTMVIIKITSTDGIIGWGESTTIGGMTYGPESPESMKLTVDQYISPLLIGKDATNINVLMHEINRNVKGNTFTKAGIETALLDSQGKRLGVSVAELFGGSINSKLPVLWTLASGNTEKDIEEAKHLIKINRHDTFKLKIGSNEPKKDVVHVVAIKKALGENIRITVDINQAWNEYTAKIWIKVLQDNGIDLIEQPIIKTNFDGLARLTEYFHVPIMADEAVATTEDAMKLCKIRGGSVFAIKIMKTGGLYNAAKIAGMAEASDIGLYGGTMLEGTIGSVASAHIFSTFTNLSWGTELFGPMLLTDDIVTNPMVFKDCKLELPKGPGLGIEVDEDKLNHYKRK
ncbi:muconate cycloisomerase [Flavobacteriaceae bacterium JJC]|uniref:muconate/chloromuconate family cycloisomerase n=1 Tax=Kaistella soli TaxID=2849654 RepID=UPI000B4A9F92|nr:muconate/chloromuconate family cycloisomerase [Kaistella soli]MBU8882537.1 muconate/chloromuconate family cycloisomerase [Kaistella soli]OWK73293.1 muconate cycloisomerase [Flavobacteriaceae bacterium JJC]